MTDSTVSGNTGGGNGGGLLFSTLNLPSDGGSGGSMDGSTIAGNASTDGSGGIEYDASTSRPVTIRNTILAANLADNYHRRIEGPNITSLGHNLSTDTTTASVFTATGDLNNVLDPRLGPLADNGGPTFTQALLPGSPAISAGDPTGAPATDQRGLARVVGGKIDIGAFEVQALAPPRPRRPLRR